MWGRKDFCYLKSLEHPGWDSNPCSQSQMTSDHYATTPQNNSGFVDCFLNKGNNCTWISHPLLKNILQLKSSEAKGSNSTDKWLVVKPFGLSTDELFAMSYIESCDTHGFLWLAGLTILIAVSYLEHNIVRRLLYQYKYTTMLPQLRSN